MANRLEFSVSVDAAGFKRGMMEIEASANATNLRLQNLLKAKITGMESRMAGMDPNSWEYVQANQRKLTLEKSLLATQNAMYLRGANDRVAIDAKVAAEAATADASKVASNRAALASIMAAETEAATLEQHLQDESLAKAEAVALAKKQANEMAWIAGQAEFRKIQEAELALMLANFEKQRVAAAALAAEQEATLLLGARGFGPSVSQGGSHGGGGIAGIIRESLVIVREIAAGRGMGRVAGSVTLLAQYLGVLKLAVRSTATEALLASEAESKLYTSMAKTALAAKGTAAYATLSAAALGQLKVATNAATEAEIALAGATVTLRAAFFIWIGVIVAVAAAAFLLFRHYSYLAQSKKNLKELTDATTKTFTDEAAAAREDAKAHQELHRWLTEQLDNRKELVDVVDRQIKKLHEEAEAHRELARAKGGSMSSINSMEVEELKNEEKLLQAAKDRAAADLDLATIHSDQADMAFTKNPSIGGVDLLGANKALGKSGEIVDAVRAAMEEKSHELQSIALHGLFGKMTPVMKSPKDSDPMDIDVGGKKMSLTLKDAMEAYQKNSGYVDELTKLQGKLADDLENAKGDVKASSDALKKYNNDLADVKDRLGIKSGLGAQSAAAQDAKKSVGRGLPGGDSLVSAGNFLGTARSGIENLAAEHVRIAREQLGHLRSIDSKISHGGHSFSGT